MNNINNINLQPGLNGLPPVKAQSSDYEEQEKIEIAKAAREYGINAVAKAYGLKWQSVSAWMKKKQGNMKSNIETKIIVQSPTGQEITAKEIKEKIKALETAGTIDAAYVRADENAIYWV
ncbi:MAG: hypothetical protein IKN30_05010, partial [Synergistaceae bacterium]|nr:hypothetical protein [Synergistaceae bacterium]